MGSFVEFGRRMHTYPIYGTEVVGVNDPEIHIGDRLYHWRYGPMTVMDFPVRKFQDHTFEYILLEIDNCDEVIWDKKAKTERAKLFLRSSIKHWIHERAMDTVIDNDNEFSFVAGSKPRPFAICCDDRPFCPNYDIPEGRSPLEPIPCCRFKKLFHEGLKNQFLSQISELTEYQEFLVTMSQLSASLKESREYLKKEQDLLDAIKNNEKDYLDHDRFDKDIRECESRIEAAQSDVNEKEVEYSKCKRQNKELEKDMSKILDKHGIPRHHGIIQDASDFLKEYVQKTEWVLPKASGDRKT